LSEYFEIAYAAASNRLCFFTGTGFSKAVTNNVAPSWQGLLERLCDQIPNSTNLKAALFPADNQKTLSLEEVAQVVSIELLKFNKTIHEEIAEIIKILSLVGDNSAISNFLSKESFKVVTTNYDKLIEQLIDSNCHSISPGLPVPRSQARVKVYHVHGSIDSPQNMVVTSDDYFKFINNETYFSRKLSTILHENTVVILGYSLGDTNLKAIINAYKDFSRKLVIGSNIFLISRSKVDQCIKDYYSHCYGIRVLDEKNIRDFFKQLNDAMPEAKKLAESSIKNIDGVFSGKLRFNADYLKIENSFFEIVNSVAAIGKSINDPRIVSILGGIIQTKIKFTQESGAWEQYTHLANWLIYLASILELKGTTIETIYLDGVLQSMNTMKKEKYFGYSWDAYISWSNNWTQIIASNRAIIRKHIQEKTTNTDALSVVACG
jgi:hypothetical protein